MSTAYEELYREGYLTVQQVEEERRCDLRESIRLLYSLDNEMADRAAGRLEERRRES